MPPFSSGVKKACQKQIYSLLSSRPWVAGLALVGLLWCLGSLMHIFKLAMLFSFHEHIRQPENGESASSSSSSSSSSSPPFSSSFSSSSGVLEEGECVSNRDNLGERHFSELCNFQPIDVVYTWVNGSDPSFQAQLHYYRPLFLKQHGLEEDLQERSTAPPVACPEGYWPYHSGSHCCEFPFDKNNQTLKFTSDTCFNNSYVTCPGGAQEGRCAYSCPDEMTAYHLGSHCCNFTADRDGKPLFFESDTCWANQYIICPGGPEDGRCIPNMLNGTDSDNATRPSQGVAMLRQRFRDNEELRYSLRSLWEYAPWIRHIYIVTNGQLPNWINLDHPRLTMISHEDILPPDALPTFASPSIETGLTKIPGLADRFIYFNDDIMLGSKVWPDDFYTLARGQKIFLAWSVPSGDPLPCSPGCAYSDIKNGYCDPACNVTQCDFDGGDCEPDEDGIVRTRAPTTAAPTSVYSNYFSASKGDSCNSGCVDNWLGDGVCDRQCKVKVCGFDMGDCGIESVVEVLGEVLENEEGEWVVELPVDVPGFYVNVSVLGHVLSASHDGPARLRSAIIPKGEGVLTVLLRPPPPSGFHCPPNTTAYHKGSHCCKYAFDRDGVPLAYDADTCKNNSYVPCPGGSVEGRCLPSGVNGPEPLTINFRLKVAGVSQDFEFNVTVIDIPPTPAPTSPSHPSPPSTSTPSPRPTSLLLSHIYSSAGSVMPSQFVSPSFPNGSLNLSSFASLPPSSSSTLLSSQNLSSSSLASRYAPSSVLNLSSLSSNSSLSSASSAPASSSSTKPLLPPSASLTTNVSLSSLFPSNISLSSLLSSSDSLSSSLLHNFSHLTNVTKKKKKKKRKKHTDIDHTDTLLHAQNITNASLSSSLPSPSSSASSILLINVSNISLPLSSSSSSSQAPTLARFISKVSSRLKKLRMSPLPVNSSLSAAPSNTARIVVSRRFRETAPPTSFHTTKINTTNHTTNITHTNLTMLNSNNVNMSSTVSVNKTLLFAASPSSSSFGSTSRIRKIYPRGLLEFDERSSEYNIDNIDNQEKEEEDEEEVEEEEEAAAAAEQYGGEEEYESAYDEDDEIGEDELLLIESRSSNFSERYGDFQDEEEGDEEMMEREGPEDLSGVLRLISKQATRARRDGRRKLAAAWLWLEQSLMQEITGEEAEEATSLPRRTLLEKIDTFAESLKWVNALYDAELGKKSRSVPAHMPHFIDKTILERVHARWPVLFNQTAHHRFRHPRDMQFALSYYYYLIQVTRTYDPERAFEEIDRDNDGLIGGRADFQALRLAVGIDLPGIKKEPETSYSAYSHSWNSQPTPAPTVQRSDRDDLVFASLLLNVSLVNLTRNLSVPEDFNLSLPVFLGLGALQARLMREEQKKPLFKHQMEDSDQVEFFMVGSDVTKVRRRLAELRTKQPKFICLNDDMGPDADGQLALALKDFYTTYLPNPCPLELPPGQVHGYASIAEYRSSHRVHAARVLRKFEGVEVPLLLLLSFLVICVVLACLCKPKLLRSHAL